VLEYLTQYYKVTLLWYNPNIWPPEENDKRLHYQRKIINALGLKEDVSIVIPDYDHDRYLQMVSGLESEPEGGLRCTECFRMRLKEAAEAAERLGIGLYCTTLTVSPHKNAEKINTLGEEIGREHGVRFLPSDFKKRNGYKRSIELSREYDLYRQDYCGCEFAWRGEREDGACPV
jgi:predicted adenine nucleotide alpha hydrolase (AANH) superfamily ATPase